MIRYCRNCGVLLESGSRFCQNCGMQVNEESLSSSQVATARSRKKNHRGIWIPVVALITAAALMLLLVFGLGRLPKNNSNELDSMIDRPDQADFTVQDIVAEGTMEPGGTTIQSSDGAVSMSFDDFCVDQPTDARIVRLTVENPPEDCVLNVYDFSLDTKSTPAGVITIEVPYDPAQIPEGLSAADCVSGVYYNDELHEWIEEAYTIDESRHTVTIKTTHLSPHGTRISLNSEGSRLFDLLIKISEGTPHEYVIPLASDYVPETFIREEIIELIEELKASDGTAPEQALNDAAVKIMGDSGSFSGIGVETFKLTSYAGEWSKYLGTRLGELSGALVLAQLASDVYYEKPQAETYFNLLKGWTYWKGAAAAAYLAGPVGATVATAVLAGMFMYEFFVEPIDIPQYIEESNHQVIVDAYSQYYHSGENYRTKSEWLKAVNTIIEKANKEDRSGDDFSEIFKDLLDKEITAYATEFFNEKPSRIREYVGQSFDIRQGYLGRYDRVYSTKDKRRNEANVKDYVTEIIGGEYEGLTTSLQDELINRLKKELYDQTIPEIMDMRKEYQYLKQLDYFRQAQQNICQYLNTRISLKITDRGTDDDEVSEFKGCYAVPVIDNPPSAFQLERWIVQLDHEGNANLDMTLLAHQMAGDFTQLSLFDQDDYDQILDGTAEPVMILDIGIIDSNEHVIEFGDQRTDITISGSRTITYETADDPVDHKFEAISDYEDDCTIKWNFGDGSDPIETDGPKSTVSHMYETQGVFTVTAGLFDADDVQLAEDTITLSIEGQSGATVYTGEYILSDYNEEYDDGSFHCSDQIVTLREYGDGTWRLTFDVTIHSTEKWPPATDMSKTATFHVDVESDSLGRYIGEVEGTYQQSGTYQGNDVSGTETIRWPLNVYWNINDSHQLKIELSDIYHSTIDMTKSGAED